MEQKKGKFTTWLRNSITARMLVVGFLLLVLLIPLEFVKSLIRERSYRQTEVIQDINQKWGNEVTFSGPILKIPYKTYKETQIFNQQTQKYQTETETIIKHIYQLPDTLDIVSDVKTQPLNRSIYESVVYTADMKFKGNFPVLDFSDKDIKNEDILWDKVTVLVQTSNIKGIRSSMNISLADQTVAMTPVFDKAYLHSIQSEHVAGIKEKSNQSIPFSFDVKINGSERLFFIPIGKETKVAMTSNWHSPSHKGKYLPMDGSRVTGKDGFKASWEVYQINRQFEQTFLYALPNLSEFAFGTELIIPVDEYQKTERTAKYGFMVIGLTLLVFLMIQIGSKIYIHPFQYVMIGLALVMFYTLLLSISEHSNFLKAYAVAAAAVLVLITSYSKAILKGFKFPLLICLSLASLYSFIYVIIQLENYALLVGSVGLFIILAVIMFASRKIDWGNQ